MPNKAKKYHKRLSEYFTKVADPYNNRRWEGKTVRPFMELPFQLEQIEKNKINELLWNPYWDYAKLNHADFYSLISDFLYFPEDIDLRLVQEALFLSMSTLINDKTQFVGQLFCRLSCIDRVKIKEYLKELEGWIYPPWLRPLFPQTIPSLIPPGGGLISRLGGHLTGVTSVSIVDDGSLAASGAQDGSISIWDLQHLKRLHKIVGHNDEVNTLIITQINGDYILASGAGKRIPFKLTLQNRSVLERTDTRTSRDNKIRIWNITDGSLKTVLEGHTAAVRCLISCGRLLLSGSDDGTIRMWDLCEGRSLGILGNQGAPVILLAMIPNCLVVVAFSEYDFQLWNILERSGSGKGKFDYRWQNVLAFDPAGMLVALQETTLSGEEFRLRIWDILKSQDGDEFLSTVTTSNTSFSVAQFIPDGKHIFVGGTDCSLRLFDVDTGENIEQLMGHKEVVTCISVSETNGKCISGALDGSVLFWNYQPKQRSELNTGHSDDVNSISVSGDGLIAVSASHDRSLIVWETSVGKPLLTIHGHQGSIKSTAININGTHILSGSNDWTVRYWSVLEAKQLYKLEGHKYAVTCVAFSSDNYYAISGSGDKTLKVWDLSNGCERLTFKGHQYGIRALAVFHHSNVVVSGDESGLLIVWNLISGNEIRRIKHFCDIDKLHSSTKHLWGFANGPVWQSSKEERHIPCIESIAISPDDKQLLVARRDKAIIVWDIENGVELVKLQGHTGIVFDVAIYSNGERAISVSDDNSLKVWDLINGICTATFTADFPLYSCAVSPDCRTILVGEGARSGKVHFLTLTS
ncbi:MAG: WD40 repeat domain-containing protein [Ignavibacteriaceae bacterium]|nr:WD40 repeat domain-containing protein [Ignavibacteriaceae bacterium]